MGLYRVAPDGTVSKATDETNRSTFSVNDNSRLRLADDLDIAPDGRDLLLAKPRSATKCINGRSIHWRAAATAASSATTLATIRPARSFAISSFPTASASATTANPSSSPRLGAAASSGTGSMDLRAASLETVIASLPGYPDNINRSSDGHYWLAIVGMRSPAVDLAFQLPGFRRRMSRRVAQDEWLYPNLNTGCVVKFNDKGEILDALWDLKGTNHPMITSMREHKGSLYLGGIANNRIGRYRLPGADPSWHGFHDYWGTK